MHTKHASSHKNTSSRYKLIPSHFLNNFFIIPLYKPTYHLPGFISLLNMNFLVIWVWPRCGVLIHTSAWKYFNKGFNRKSRTPTGSVAVFWPYKVFAVAVIICIFCWHASQSSRLYVLSLFENQKCKFVSYKRQNNTLTLVLAAWLFSCFHRVMRFYLPLKCA